MTEKLGLKTASEAGAENERKEYTPKKIALNRAYLFYEV